MQQPNWHAYKQHARAVREAIQTARQVNEQWNALAQQVAHAPPPTDASASAATTATTATAMAATGNRPDEPGPMRPGTGARYINVSDQDVLLAIRIGTRLIVIDDHQNRHSAIVRAVDGLLTRAKKMVDTDGRQRVSLSTEVEGQPDTRVSIDVVPTGKGSATTMHYERGAARERISPIGVVDFFLG